MQRLNAITESKWIDIVILVERIRSVDKSNLEAHFDVIHSKLVTYEHDILSWRDPDEREFERRLADAEATGPPSTSGGA